VERTQHRTKWFAVISGLECIAYLLFMCRSRLPFGRFVKDEVCVKQTHIDSASEMQPLYNPSMPEEIFPSSYLCDCGHQSDFFENTIREAKSMSFKKRIYLSDSEQEEHTIVFYKGKMVDIICPKAKGDILQRMS